MMKPEPWPSLGMISIQKFMPSVVAAMFTTGIHGVYATIDKLVRGTARAGDPGSLGGSLARFAAVSKTITDQRETLADKQDDVPTAAAILRPVLADDPRRAHWIDLIGRLQACGLTERPGAADELTAALKVG